MLRCGNCGNEIKETLTKPIMVCKECNARLIRLGINPWKVISKEKYSFPDGSYVKTTFIEED